MEKLGLAQECTEVWVLTQAERTIINKALWDYRSMLHKRHQSIADELASDTLSEDMHNAHSSHLCVIETELNQITQIINAK